MLCLRCSRGLSSSSRLSIFSKTVQKTLIPSSRRSISILSPRRPTLFPSSASLAPFPSTITPTTSTTGEVLDLLPKISQHPALGGIQVRCGPRNTFNPSHFKRKRRHGFLSRIRTRKGRSTLQRRKDKKRSTLSH